MNGLVFQDQLPVTVSHPNRTDIACFVGFVARRQTPLPTLIKRWLDEQGWTTPPYQRSSDSLNQLLDLPVPIENWEIFDQIFAWERREYKQHILMGTTYLGAAVRSFFAQGGRKCYVVRVGDPWLGNTSRSERLTQISRLIPGYPDVLRVSPVDRNSWSGVGHLFGLPDVSFLCLPDLADAVSVEPQKPKIEPPSLPLPIEQFVECSQPQTLTTTDIGMRYVNAPRCDDQSYNEWGQALRLMIELINIPRLSAPPLREIQIVASVPIPETGTKAEKNLLTVVNSQNLASAFLQLVYPWVKTRGAVNLPEQLESPDAVLTGILARNALMRGTFRSAANLELVDVQNIYPVLSREQILQPHPEETTNSHTLKERVSLFVPTPKGLRLLSDVTTSPSASYRPASVNRLMATIIRTARGLGEEIAFESSGEQLWAKLRYQVNNLLLAFYQIGALGGNSAAEAFLVKCDRTTMSQDDIDNGRVIATIEFTPATAIEQITVILAINEGGQVSLLSSAAT